MRQNQKLFQNQLRAFESDMKALLKQLRTETTEKNNSKKTKKKQLELASYPGPFTRAEGPGTSRSRMRKILLESW